LRQYELENRQKSEANRSINQNANSIDLPTLAKPQILLRLGGHLFDDHTVDRARYILIGLWSLLSFLDFSKYLGSVW
jgi:hypothetical protein